MTFLSLPLVLDAVAKASVILAVTALAAAALRRASASARHFVWTLGLLSALAAPALSVALPRWELPIVRVRAVAPASNASSTPNAWLPPSGGSSGAVASDSTSSRILPPEGGSHEATPASARPAQTNATSQTTTSEITTAGGASIPWRAIAIFAWIAGAAVVLGRMFLGLAAVLWMSRRTPVVTDAPWLPQARALADGLGLSGVRFLRTGASTMPMAWGVFRLSVLMPADADTWPAHRLRVVLLHELAHVKRRDCLTHLVAQIACAAYWFNPLAWMAARRLRTERERACDDLVLASGTRGSDYADQLLDIARVMRSGRFPAVLAGASLAMAQRSQLEGRLMAILDPSVPRRGLTRTRALAAAVVFALLIVPVASVQPWAEERAAVKASSSEIAQAEPPQAPEPQKPIESYPGQADADNRRNAKNQDAIQGRLQDHLQAGIQGGIQSGIQGGVQGGVASGVGSSVGRAIGAQVGEAVVGIVDGIAVGVADAVHQAAVEHDAQDQDKDKDKNKNRDDSSKGRASDPRMVNALMEALKDTDKEVRETAMHALVQMRDPRIFEPLVAALKDASADVREQAAFGLGQLHDARAVDALASVLKDADADVREQAVFALGQLHAASAVEAIVTALRDANDSVREQAAFALGQIRDRRGVEGLISALKDTKPNVREQAAFALGQMRDPRAIEALVVALKDANSSVREQAAFALGQSRDARAIDGLMVALKDPNPEVRRQAAFALGQIR